MVEGIIAGAHARGEDHTVRKGATARRVTSFAVFVITLS
jgi:hypothetical protein